MKSSRLVFLAGLILSGNAPLQATNYYWDTNGVTAGSGAMTGSWGTDGFWTTDSTGSTATSAVTMTNADDLFFAAGTSGTTGTIAVSATQYAHSLTFDDNVVVTLSGGTAINLGNATANSGVFVTAASNKTISTAIVLNSAATAVAFSNTTAATLALGTITGSATTGTQAVTINSTSTGNITFGNIADGSAGGNLSINKTGNGLATISGTNAYTGTTTVSAGTLQLSSQVSLYGNNSNSWTASNIIVNSGATLTFNVGAAGQFSATNIDSLKGLGTATGGFKSGSFLGLDTTGGSFSYSSAIANTNAGTNIIGLVKTGGNALTLSGTNSYTGGTKVYAGTVNVSGDQSSANGGWQIDGTNYAGLIVNFQTGSTIVVASGKTASLSSNSASGRAPTMNVAGSVTNSGSLSVGRDSNLYINSGGTWSQSGSMSVATSSSTFASAAMTVNSGGSFTYAGSAAISLNPSSGGTGQANLTINGGTFTTNKGFATTINSGAAAANLTLTGGGTLKLSADVAKLTSASGSNPLNFLLGTGGGVIDTNGFSATVDRVIANVSGQTGSLTKSGAGTLTLSATHAYTGATNITAGTLALGHATDTLSSSTAVTVDGATAVLAIASNSDTVGAVTLKNGGSITGTGGTLTGASYAVESGSVSANLGGLGVGLTKSNSGTVTLSGINTYTGTTTVSAGTLLVNGQLGNTAVTVTGGAIGGTGTIGSSLTLNSGALFEVVDLTDGLAVAGAISLFSGFGIDDLAGMNWGGVADGTYTLISGTLADGNFAQLSNNSLASAYDIGGGRKAYFQQGSLQLVVVPETSAALLGGVGALLLLRRRRG